MIRLLACAALLAAPAAALAGESPVPSISEGVVTSIASVVVFVICMAVLGTMVWPKISKGLADRENKIKSEIEAAEAAKRQAKEALAQYEKNLADARVEAQKEIDQARASAQQIAADLKAKADTELSAMKDKAMREIDAAKKAALAEIYAESAGLATAVAGKILQREINRNDQQRLVQDALHEMKPAAARA